MDSDMYTHSVFYHNSILSMLDSSLPNNALPFLPNDFVYDQVSILKYTIKANNALAKLNGLAMLLPNAELLMAPLLIKESVESNAIENINTTALQVLQAEAMDVGNLT
jgi:Fic family protein